jgi:hypothetical protein
MPVPKGTTPLPSLDQMNLGYDILLLDLTMAGLDQAGRQSIFAFEPSTEIPGPDYDDQYPAPLPPNLLWDTSFSSVGRVIQTSSDMQRSTGASMSASGSDEGVQFSGNASYQYANQNTQSLATLLDEASSVVSLWELSLNEGAALPLASDFANAVKGLPASYAGNEPVYGGFIEQFGTHYATSAVFGGRTYQRSSSETEQASTGVTPGINGSMEADIERAASVGRSVDISSSSFQAWKSSVIIQNIEFVGGVASLQNWDDWVKTVRTRPVVVSANFAPLYELLTTANFPATDVPDIGQIQTNLVQAFAAYIQTGSDPTAGALHVVPHDALQAPNQPLYFSAFQNLDYQIDAWIAKDGVSIVNLNPNPAAANRDFWPIDQSNPNSAAPIFTGQGQDHAVAYAWNQNVETGYLTFPNPQGAMGLGPWTNDSTSNVTWYFVNPLLPANPGLVFPSQLVQLVHAATSKYLDYGGSEIGLLNDPTNPSTFWVVKLES